ncbi:MAG: hypothetical protein DCC43_11575, partial [Candidatus Brocadia sp.]
GFLLIPDTLASFFKANINAGYLFVKVFMKRYTSIWTNDHPPRIEYALAIQSVKDIFLPCMP